MQHLDDWEQSWGTFARHPSLSAAPARIDDVFDRYLERLGGNYPFHHPRYAGQMLKPPHPVAMAAYMAAMRINPNNHALDGGPPTSAMEKEVVADLAHMLGLPKETLGHLTGGGTVANLEALWVAREQHPDRGFVCSEAAHYTHTRMAKVLGVRMDTVPTDAHERIDLNALEEVVQKGDVGTVVLTAGTTGLGVVDPIADAIALCRSHGVRVHVDAAYGGFFALAAQRDDVPPNFPAADFAAIAEADSVVIDPHKHGLQPYGCGCVLFRDPGVGTVYAHDSPYTYFTSDDLHLGEISLECSRPGAAAGALWCTLQILPLHPTDGVGAIVHTCLEAARTWAAAVREASALQLYMPPTTDIVAYAPRIDGSAADLNTASRGLFERAMTDERAPIFTSLYQVPAERATKHLEGVTPVHADQVSVLRSVLMKPEHRSYAASIVDRLNAWAEA
ncbi:pyridoxal phosphate-dependent decarboxylase family protein [Salisaeta longa]|uniref:pyridoxal phosphate-dependent decarboxylase family protein n=1 Tax=Salisaeta longa TaxID=503170 RepID=UPI0003B6B4D6